MQAAPLWDPVQCKFTGILTVTDFIDILRYFRTVTSSSSTQESTTNTTTTNSPKRVGDLAVWSIADILQNAQAHGALQVRPFGAAESTCSLHRACLQLLQSGQDYLPIMYTQDMRVLACLTYTHILEHLVTHFREQRRLFDDSITDLGIGTYGSQLVTATPNQTLAQALELMAQHGLSALPVVEHLADGSRVIVGAYSRSDITFLTKAKDADDAMSNLNLTLAHVLEQTRHDVTTPDALRTCSPSHTLQAIFESFAQVRFHRLYVVQEHPVAEEENSVPSIAMPGMLDLNTTTTAPSTMPGGLLGSMVVDPTSTSGGVTAMDATPTTTHPTSRPPILLGVVSAKDLVAYFLQDALRVGGTTSTSTTTTTPTTTTTTPPTATSLASSAAATTAVAANAM